MTKRIISSILICDPTYRLQELWHVQFTFSWLWVANHERRSRGPTINLLFFFCILGVRANYKSLSTKGRALKQLVNDSKGADQAMLEQGRLRTYSPQQTGIR